MGSDPKPSVITIEQQTYQGNIPPPALLRDFDAIVPGAAQKILVWAEEEQLHRRKLEIATTEANIEAQKRQLSIAEFQASSQSDLATYQSRSVNRSDLVGQAAGFVVCITCVVGACYLAVTGHEWVGAALAAIPTAAIVKSFRGKLWSPDTNKR